MEINYYVYSGDPEVGERFTAIIFGRNRLSEQLKEHLNKSYGKDLKIILLRYYLDGKIAQFPHPKRQLSNFLKKEKAIVCNFNISQNTLIKKTDLEIIEFIKTTSLEGIRLVKDKFSKKEFHFDFDLLIKDVENYFQNRKGFILDDFVLN